MVLLAGVAFAMLASSLWMAIGPQLPGFRTRRAALAWLTWLVSRGTWVAAALPAGGVLTGAAWQGLARIAALGSSRGVPGAGPFDLPNGGAGLVALLVTADLAVWRALAAAEGEAGEAAWSWVASPFALWIAVVLGAPRAVPLALVALAFLLLRRGRHTASGLAIGAAAACGGPAVLAVSLALALAPGGRLARARAALATGAAGFALLHGYARVAWGWTWWPPADPGGGVGVSGLVFALTGHAPGAWAWLPCLALLAVGFARLVPRGAGAPVLAAWAFGAFALFAPGFAVRSALPFAPLLAVWAADDPDRRGWWFLECLALALAAVFESVAIGDGARAGWRLAAMLGILGVVLLGLWPLRVPGDPPAVSPHA